MQTKVTFPMIAVKVTIQFSLQAAFRSNSH